MRIEEDLRNPRDLHILSIILIVGGLFLVLLSNNLVPLSIFPTTSIYPNMNNFSSSFTSTPIAHPILLSLLNLTSGSIYRWTVTVSNTGSVPWTAYHITIRIVNANLCQAVIINSQNPTFDNIFGVAGGGQGAYAQCSSPSGFVVLGPNAENGVWGLSASNGEQVFFNSNGTVASVTNNNGLSPGQSQQITFTLTIPGLNSSQFGNYYAIMDLVAYSPSVSGAYLVNDNVQEFYVGAGVNGALSLQGVEFIGGLTASILGAILYVFSRRRI